MTYWHLSEVLDQRLCTDVKVNLFKHLKNFLVLLVSVSFLHKLRDGWEVTHSPSHFITITLKSKLSGYILETAQVPSLWIYIKTTSISTPCSKLQIKHVCPCLRAAQSSSQSKQSGAEDVKGSQMKASTEETATPNRHWPRQTQSAASSAFIFKDNCWFHLRASQPHQEIPIKTSFLLLTEKHTTSVFKVAIKGLNLCVFQSTTVMQHRGFPLQLQQTLSGDKDREAS